MGLGAANLAAAPVSKATGTDGTMASRQVAESRPEIAPKPSPCIKWDNGSATLAAKSLRMTKGAPVVGNQKNFQAKNENHI